jgi:hypothetical protein
MIGNPLEPRAAGAAIEVRDLHHMDVARGRCMPPEVGSGV